MIREIIDEAVYLFGGMPPREIIKTVMQAVLLFGLMWVNIVLWIIAFG